MPAPAQDDGVGARAQQALLGRSQVVRLAHEHAHLHARDAVRRIAGADGQRRRDVLLQAYGRRIRPVGARPADGVDGAHAVLHQLARLGRPWLVGVEGVHQEEVEVAAAGVARRVREGVHQLAPRGEAQVANRHVAVAERPVLVGEHRRPRPGRRRAPLHLEDGRVEGRRRADGCRPRGKAERGRRRPRHAEPERVPRGDVGRGRRAHRQRLRRLEVRRRRLERRLRQRRVDERDRLEHRRDLDLVVARGRRAKSVQKARPAQAELVDRGAEREPRLRSRWHRRRDAERGVRRPGREDEVVTLRKLEDEGADRHREVDDEAPVVERRGQPERLATRIDGDPAPREPHAPRVRRPRSERDRRRSREPQPHLVEGEVGREERLRRDGREAVVSIVDVLVGEGRADPVLVRLARHEGRVVVEEREAEGAAPGRVREQDPGRVERTHLLGVGVVLLAHEQRELRRARRVDQAQARPDDRGEARELLAADRLARQQPAPRLGQLVGVASERRHELAERERQALDDRRHVVPRRVVARPLDVDAHLEQRRRQRHDDDRVDPQRPQHVSRRAGRGAADADDPALGQRDGERALRRDDDADEPVGPLEIDAENVGVRRCCARARAGERLEPAARRERDDAERQRFLARRPQRGDPRRVEPLALPRLEALGEPSPHRPALGRVDPRARAAPREMDADPAGRDLGDPVRVHRPPYRLRRADPPRRGALQSTRVRRKGERELVDAWHYVCWPRRITVSRCA